MGVDRILIPTHEDTSCSRQYNVGIANEYSQNHHSPNKMPHPAAYGIFAVQALFFVLGGIRDNFAVGTPIMPEEKYLQSWWLDTKLGDYQNHSPRMHAIAMSWGAFIATIALLKFAVALTGGKTPLAKTLAMIFVVTNVWVCVTFYPYQGLLDEHYSNKKLFPEGNKGDTMGFIGMLAVESVCWVVATELGAADLKSIKMA